MMAKHDGGDYVNLNSIVKSLINYIPELAKTAVWPQMTKTFPEAWRKRLVEL